MTPQVFYGVFAMLTVAAGAEPVYKCEEKGVITYTDQPCAAGARQQPLPPLVVVQPPGRLERERARDRDAQLARDRAERDRSDAEWLKRHHERRDREARVRKAIIEHRVIKSMTRDEVKQALGEPDRVAGGDSYGSAKETWTYVDESGRRTVNFKDGEVTTTSRKDTRRGGKRGR
jgi:hypothetical protein